ncbi:MAG: DUF262 domain-containing protein [Candidatus Portiera sp.]|nr:DUF262 domain-containing protein [Portiera sp.]
MIEADRINLIDIFTQSTSLVIPFFQRKYVWDEDNWQDLWEGVYALYINPDRSEYFMGNLLFKKSKPYSKSNELEVVDGQQRLITISILLKALENLCDNDEENELRFNIEQMLKVQNKLQEARPRIECSLYDKKCYNDIINCSSHTGVIINCEKKYKRYNIFKCYNFFREKIQEEIINSMEVENNIPENVKDLSVLDRKRTLMSIISSDGKVLDSSKKRSNISFVRIGLKEEDDEQEIFDTLNSLGKPLSVSELVKNYIFRKERFDSDDKLLNAYEEFWKQLFEKDDHKWWQTAASSKGKKSRNNLELFLHSFLVIKLKRNNSIITMDALFAEYKKFINAQSNKKKINELLIDIKEHAEIYRKYFLTLNDIDSIKYSDWNGRLFLTLGIIRSTSVHPLILYYYHRYQDDTMRENFANAIINFMLRRSFCNLTGKNYNYLFCQAVHDMSKDDADFPSFIAKYDSETRKFPSDDEFYSGLLTSNKTKPDYWKLLLYFVALKQIDQNKADIETIDFKSKLEYIIPRNWQKTKWYRNSMNHDEIEETNRLVNTLGNVALVPKNWDKATSKKVWPDKKEVLKMAGAFPNMDDYLTSDTWGKAVVIRRSEVLFKEVLDMLPNIIN